MLGSAVVYTGLVIATAGSFLIVKPIPLLHIVTRSHGAAILGAGILLVSIGFIAPASESSVSSATTRLDEFAPAWQFNEVHTIHIAAPPARVFDAIQRVRADEIFLFQTLTWIRRAGRPIPEGILNARGDEPLLDLVTRTSFIRLADDAPRELVVGTVISAPPGTRGKLTPQVFQRTLPAGFVLATMNFLVNADGANASVVRTETRVFANSPSARRQFAAYWRVIYPGSSIIRRMWLRAIERRATG
jgi:hypothetical protein